MAVIQRATELQSDAPPLWLPRHDAEVLEQSAARPPDFVEGYTGRDRLATFFFGSRYKTATTVSTAVAVLLFFVALPSLFGAGIVTMLRLAFYQAWTLGLLLMVTVRYRTISVGTAARYWLAGLFAVGIVSYGLHGIVGSIVSPSSVWVTPVLEELLKALALFAAIMLGRRTWRHPGLCDLVLLGFAVGAGYGFHEAALWERSAASGFEWNLGLLVPSIWQPEGYFIVGQAGWTALLGLSLGLFALHRHNAIAVLSAVVIAVCVVADHMSVNDSGTTLDLARHILLDGTLVGVILIAAIVAAVALDHYRLAAIAQRDHLFPDENVQANPNDSSGNEDPLHRVLVSRYRRLRNGMHTTVGAASQQWPPLSESHRAPLAELARLGRAANVGVGPGASSSGWAPDPESPEDSRFVGPHGFTAYAASATPVDPVMSSPSSSELEGLDLEAQARLLKEAEREAARRAAAQPTATSLSVPKARLTAQGQPRRERPAEYWQTLGLASIPVVIFVVLRLLTADDIANAALGTVMTLPDAPNNPSLIIGGLGALASVISLRGRDIPHLEAGWDIGPGDDPTPERPDECEA